MGIRRTMNFIENQVTSDMLFCMRINCLSHLMKTKPYLIENILQIAKPMFILIQTMKARGTRSIIKFQLILVEHQNIITLK
jgi:hypothetical protein